MLQLPWTLLPQDSQDPPGYNKISTAASNSTRSVIITQGLFNMANFEIILVPPTLKDVKIGIVIIEKTKRYARNHR
jgi:hypothetical protein